MPERAKIMRTRVVKGSHEFAHVGPVGEFQDALTEVGRLRCASRVMNSRGRSPIVFGLKMPDVIVDQDGYMVPLTPTQLAHVTSYENKIINHT